MAAKRPSDVNDPLDKAADRLRDSAKWLVAAFGAVAAVGFAGLTVADLGDLAGDTPGYRMAVALVGGAAASVSVVAALAQAMRLAGASTTTVEDLTRDTRWWERSLKITQDDLKRDAALTTWGGDVNAFVEDYKGAYDEYVQRAEAYALDDRKKAPDLTKLKKAMYRLEVMAATKDRLLTTASFLRLQQSFLRARTVIASLLVISAAGASAFAWATSSVPEQPPELNLRAAAGTLRPDDNVVKELNRQLPATCARAVGDEVPVIVLARNEDSTARIVTVPTRGCDPASASVPEDQITSS